MEQWISELEKWSSAHQPLVNLIQALAPQSFAPEMIFVEGGSGVPGRDQDAIRPGETRTIDVRISTSFTHHESSESVSVQIIVTDQLGNEYRLPRLALRIVVPERAVDQGHSLLENGRPPESTAVAERQRETRLGIEITSPRSGETIVTWDKDGWYEIQGTYKVRPVPNVFGFVCHGGNWWPHLDPPLTADEQQKRWRIKMRFSVSGPVMLYIVSASELGNTLVEYYRKVIRDNEQRIGLLKTRGAPAGLLKGLPGEYPGSFREGRTSWMRQPGARLAL